MGENVLLEKEKKVRVIKKLGFGKCRLSIAVPKSSIYKGIHSLTQKKIATSYPNIVKRYLSKAKVSAEIHEISGSVEIAPGIGLADAVCDLVSSGSTLFMNGLREVETVLSSEAVIVAHKNISKSKQNLINKLLFRIEALKAAQNNKYILLNAPDNKLSEICALLPGMKSPTILPLAEKGWSSVHSVVNENAFWDIIEKLKEKGAQGILVVPIEKMIL